jgi:hypothetical protein
MRYTIRQLKLGEVLDQAVNLTKDHFGVFLGICAVLLIPYELIGGLIQASMLSKLPPNPTQEQQMQLLAGVARVTLPLLVLGVFVITPITNAALIYAIANAYLEKPISVGGSFKLAFQRIFTLIWTWILVGLAFSLGTLLCVVPGILAYFWFALATQVVVIESVGGFTAMKRSKDLMGGNIGAFFVLTLLLGLIGIGLGVAQALIPQPHVQAIVNAVTSVVVTIFASAAFVVFYFSCRCKHEQFDLALLAQSVGAQTPDEAGDPGIPWE